MHALLFAAALTLGTVKSPYNGIGINRFQLEVLPSADLAGYQKTTLGDVAVFTKTTANEDNETGYDLDVILSARETLYRFDGDGSAESPTVALAAPGIVRVEQEAHLSRYSMKTAWVVDLRDKPRAIKLEASTDSVGVCSALDNGYGPRSALSCNWNRGRDDFVCNEAEVMDLGWTTRVAWKQWTLFGNEPIARTSDLQDEEQLLSRRGGVISGEGAVERLPLGANLDFFFIPPTSHAFSIEGWIVDYKTSQVLAVDSDDFDPELPEDARDRGVNGADVADDGYTPDRERVTARFLKPIDEHITPLLLRDGSASALFWLGYDGETAALLRVATDAEEYTRCGGFRHPASATSIRGTTLRVGPAWNWNAGAEDSPADILSCAFTATVRWEHGFVIERTAEEAKCGKDELRPIAIADDGSVHDRTPARR